MSLGEAVPRIPPRAIDNDTKWTHLKPATPDAKDSMAAQLAVERMHTTRTKELPLLAKGVDTTAKVLPKDAAAAVIAAERLIAETMQLLQLTAQVQQHYETGTVAKLKFVWKGAWGAAGNPPTTTDCNAEIASLMWNVAAAQCALGAAHIADATAAGAKAAYVAFQAAAGWFEALEGTAAHLAADQRGSLDFGERSLALAKAVVLANAHLASYAKGTHEMKGKHSLLSKLAMEGAGLFRAALALPMDGDATPSLRVVIAQCTTASTLLEARANLHLAEFHFEEKEMGPAIARSETAKTMAASAKEKAKECGQSLVQCASWMAAVREAAAAQEAAALDKNNLVYFDRVPSDLDRPAALGKPLGKPTPAPRLTQCYLAYSNGGTVPAHGVDGPSTKEDVERDPFVGVVRRDVAEAVSAFRSETAKSLKMLLDTVQEDRQKASRTLETLGVVSAVQLLSADPGTKPTIPEDIRRRIAAARGGGKIVPSLIGQVDATQQLAASVLNEVAAGEKALQDEEKLDADFCAAFGEKLWRDRRRPSTALPTHAALTRAAASIRDDVSRDVQRPLAECRDVLQEHGKEIARLDWPEEDLDALMPFVGNTEVASRRAEQQAKVQRLKHLLERIRQTEDAEQSQMRKIQSDALDPSVVDRVAAAPEGQLTKAVDDVRALLVDRFAAVQSAMESRAVLIRDVEAAMVEIAEQRSSDGAAAEVQRVVGSLERTLNVRDKVAGRFENLAAMGAALLERAGLLRDEARSFAAGREAEAEDFKAQLEADVARRMAAVGAVVAPAPGSVGVAATPPMSRQLSHASPEEAASRQRQDDLKAQIAALEAQRLEATGRQQSNEVVAARQAAPFGATDVSGMAPYTYDAAPLQQQTPAPPQYAVPPPPAGDALTSAFGLDQAQPPQQQQQQQYTQPPQPLQPPQQHAVQPPHGGGYQPTLLQQPPPPPPPQYQPAPAPQPVFQQQPPPPAYAPPPPQGVPAQYPPAQAAGAQYAQPATAGVNYDVLFQ